jgi:F-type H+-transporting ATPase subunit a
MNQSPLQAAVLFHVGFVPVSRTVVTTWGLIAGLTAGCWIATRGFKVVAGGWQAVIETVVLGIEEQIEELLGRDAGPFIPLLGTLFIFLVVANLSGIVPGIRAPTASIETSAALASIVFLSVHFFGVRVQGFVPYLKGYLRLVRRVRQETMATEILDLMAGAEALSSLKS